MSNRVVLAVTDNQARALRAAATGLELPKHLQRSWDSIRLHGFAMGSMERPALTNRGRCLLALLDALAVPEGGDPVPDWLKGRA